MKKTGLTMALALMLGTALAGCAENDQNSKDNGEEKLKVYTTIFPVQDFTKKIGGDAVEVESIYPANADAHTFEPSTKDMVAMAEGDAFIYSGVGLEGFAEKATETLKSEEVKIIKAGDGIELADASHDEENHEEHANEESHDEHTDEEDHAEHADEESDHEHADGDAHDHGDKDPHIWLDPALSIQMAENIKNGLIEIQPGSKDKFEKNFETLKSDLEKLDADYKETIDAADKKEILVSHAAYGYWEERYGIQQISVLGLSPTQEPSQKQLQSIIETAKEHHINYIIFENNVNSKIADIVKTEIGAESLTLSNLESISEEDAKNNEDYFSLMERNLETLRTALSK
ncbi:metal ABC transporter solute-binding protein, Zn/Mn family [Metabacillus hrfriensis]|uniref:Zinc ABC transporter substrate-binding protein n=1 Tax=Metabacillus hrfriensis TaxID=3048891 RepID=A0ACD4R9W2_9BACI|nr:zinc ABC transporter substrate-binding protein [Metabacillus sp. CT-WN-B3]UOK59959.1 zinc ABC transporter substrate-binding protein [Bacillus sp. OVS6]WHZ56950.1 zinc ABC transporter substrate-binding protein [Metabacillus sp. CT-WN-B3]